MTARPGREGPEHGPHHGNQGDHATGQEAAAETEALDRS
jgi:hypothetical protein